MIILAVATTWWLLVGKSIALPTPVYYGTSPSPAPVLIDSGLGSSSTENEASSSLKNSSVSASAGSTNSAAIDSESSSSLNAGKIRDDEFSVITSNSSSSSTTSTTTTTTTTTSPHSSTDIVNSVPMTSSSTASGYTSSSSPTESSSAPEYAFSFAELLSAITAEFVFNVAGDHILFPVAEDRNDDQRLHTTAIMVAELLQKLHITPEVYRILNTSAVAVAQVVWKGRQRGANPVARVLQLTVEAAMRDPLLRDEYLAVKTRLANQIYSLPPQHGKFASTKSQTLYDVMADQLVYAEKLMKDARVKKLFMSVSFFKASQFDEASVPVWVRNQTSLARAMFQLARQSKWRNEVQRVFDEAVIENLEKYDAMAGDDESFFQALQEKIEQNVTLNAELKKMGSQFALSKT